MNNQSLFTASGGFSRIRLFWALSRTPHGLLDMATPAFAALLWLGELPSLYIILMGLLTTFSGYTAVYALNDVVDHRVDATKLKRGGFRNAGNYLDAAMVRHPIAQGFLTLREGVAWTLAWGTAACIGAYMLNPLCAAVFLGAVALEAAYCLMWRISHLRTIISGAVKTSGAMAAVYAVDPNPSAIFLPTLFFCLFFWEIGGQNIPADWTDIEEDRRVDAKTIPVCFGLRQANRIILVSIIAAILLSGISFMATRARFEIPYILTALFAGCYLLLGPALKLFKTRQRQDATALFNRASYYPAVLLLIVTIKTIS